MPPNNDLRVRPFCAPATYKSDLCLLSHRLVRRPLAIDDSHDRPDLTERIVHVGVRHTVLDDSAVLRDDLLIVAREAHVPHRLNLGAELRQSPLSFMCGKGLGRSRLEVELRQDE